MNPQTGEKIVDVIMVSSQTISRETMRLAAERTREAITHMQRGDNLAARGNTEGAIVEYQKALAINPNDAVIQNKLGICFQRGGQVDLAQRQYEQAVRLNARYAEAWNNLGSCYHARGKYKQAIKYYEKAIDNKPSFAAAYKNMGTAYFAQGRFEEGYQALQAAFRLDPTVLEAGSALGILATDMGAAVQYFYFAKLSAAYGQMDAAIDFLKKAVARGFKDCDRITQDPDFRGSGA